MSEPTAKAVSVDAQGNPDGWEVEAGFVAERDMTGSTRLIIAVPPPFLPKVHQALIATLEPPFGVLYRQRVNRRAPEIAEIGRLTEAVSAAEPGSSEARGLQNQLDLQRSALAAAPPRDFVALEVSPEALLSALRAHGSAVYHDARSELWIRGRLEEQLILDGDGLIFVYPDDPTFRDACAAWGLEERDVVTIADRDYVMHQFDAANDAHEDALLAVLRLTEVPHRKL
jgi:hypothetical protein